MQRRGEHLVRGRLDAEVVADDGVGDLVVLPAADAVDEEVAEAHAGEQRERQAHAGGACERRSPAVARSAAAAVAVRTQNGASPSASSGAGWLSLRMPLASR